MDYAIFVLAACVVGGGVVGGLIRAWSLHAEMRRLRDEVATLHDRILHEQKKRAAGTRWSNDDIKKTLETVPKVEPEPWYFGAR